MKKILIVGNYGIDGKLNGQTARTRTITSSILKISKDYDIVKVDTSKKNINTYLKFVFWAIVSKKIIILVGKKSIKSVIEFLSIFNLLNKTYYVVIGGWLYDYLGQNKGLIKKVKKINCIFVQIKGLKNKLKSINVKSIVLHNYRIIERNITYKSKCNKYVIYSRIREDKGVLIAIKAFNKINKKYPDTVLDIYGPIANDFKESFYNEIKNNENINYLGILNENGNIVETLSQYKAMLFPTFYSGEGFPGTILESFVAGVPVIASNWKYNSEIIDDSTGWIVDCNVESFVNTMELIENNKVDINKMSNNCKKKSKKFNEENAIKILKKNIGI